MKFIEKKKKQIWRLCLVIRVSQHVFSGKVGAIGCFSIYQTCIDPQTNSFSLV